MTQVYVTTWAVDISDGCLSFEPIGDKMDSTTLEAKNIQELEVAIENWLYSTPGFKAALASKAARKYPENGFVDFSIFARGPGRKFANFDKLTKALQRKLRFRAGTYVAAVKHLGWQANFLDEVGG